jgi:hypothetical protein
LTSRPTDSAIFSTVSSLICPFVPADQHERNATNFSAARQAILGFRSSLS